MASGSIIRVEASPEEKEQYGVAFNVVEERADVWDVTVEDGEQEG